MCSWLVVQVWSVHTASYPRRAHPGGAHVKRGGGVVTKHGPSESPRLREIGEVALRSAAAGACRAWISEAGRVCGESFRRSFQHHIYIQAQVESIWIDSHGVPGIIRCTPESNFHNFWSGVLRWNLLLSLCQRKCVADLPFWIYRRVACREHGCAVFGRLYDSAWHHDLCTTHSCVPVLRGRLRFCQDHLRPACKRAGESGNN